MIFLHFKEEHLIGAVKELFVPLNNIIQYYTLISDEATHFRLYYTVSNEHDSINLTLEGYNFVKDVTGKLCMVIDSPFFVDEKVINKFQAMNGCKHEKTSNSTAN